MRLVSKYIAAACGAVMLATGLSGVASAAPTGNLVTLGDSYSANPDQVRNTFRGVPGATDTIPNARGAFRRLITGRGSLLQRRIDHWPIGPAPLRLPTP